MEDYEVEPVFNDSNFTCWTNWTLLTNNITIHAPINHAYFALAGTMSLLSVIGCVLIIYCYWKEKQLRNNSRQLLLCLTVCDLLIALSNIEGIIWFQLLAYSHEELRLNDPICVSQAAITTTSSIASFLWTTCIAANIFFIVFYDSMVLVNKYRWVLHIICWGIPIATAIVVLSEKRFGYNPYQLSSWWCWIRPNLSMTQLTQQNSTQAKQTQTDIFLWQLGAGKFWEILSYLLVCGFYASVKIKLARHLRRIKKSNLKRRNSRKSSIDVTAYRSAQQKLTYIPLVFMIGRIWGTVRYLLGYYLDNKYLYQDIEVMENATNHSITAIEDVITDMQGVGDSSQGFLNFLVLMYTSPLMRNCIKSLFCRKPPLVANMSSRNVTADVDTFSDTEIEHIPTHPALIK